MGNGTVELEIWWLVYLGEMCMDLEKRYGVCVGPGAQYGNEGLVHG